MSSLLRGFSLFLLPLCGWLVGTQYKPKLPCILPPCSAPSNSYSASGRRYSTAGQTCKAFTGSFAAKVFCREFPAVHCSSCLHRGSFRRQNAPASQNVSVVLAVQRPHRNANGWITIRRGSRTICSRHAAQHSGRPVCRTVWDWQAA